MHICCHMAARQRVSHDRERTLALGFIHSQSDRLSTTADGLHIIHLHCHMPFVVIVCSPRPCPLPLICDNMCLPLDLTNSGITDVPGQR